MVLPHGSGLQNPYTIKAYSNNIDVLPSMNVFHICGYLSNFEDFDYNSFTDLDKLYSYTLAKGGYVENLEFYQYPNMDYIAVKGKVKPRTRTKDPITKLKHYSCWLILSTGDKGIIKSGYGVCKGGYVQLCIHVHILS